MIAKLTMGLTMVGAAWLAAPAAALAHPHGAEAGFPHALLHLFLGGGHLLPAIGAAVLGALAAVAGMAAARRIRAGRRTPVRDVP